MLFLQAEKLSNDLVQRELELEVERRKQLEEEKRIKEDMKKRKLEAKKRRKEELRHHETELREKILKNWKDKVVSGVERQQLDITMLKLFPFSSLRYFNVLFLDLRRISFHVLIHV